MLPPHSQSISVSLAAHVQKDKRSSFAPKSRKCVFLDIQLIIRAGSVGIRLQVCSYPEMSAL